jgi:D-beta-D-heptose 7-phosphate kinase / D-beta-D-heptose 1-phosphate adenosyltransferase
VNGSASAVRERLVVAGDVLLDLDVEGRVDRLSPDAPVPVLDQDSAVARPGGAGLAAALAAAEGGAVTLVTAIAADPAGRLVRSLLEARGIEVVDLGLVGSTPEKVRFRAAGRSLMRLDRGGHGAVAGRAGRALLAAIERATAVLVSDYGRGLADQSGLRDALVRAARRVPVVWDPHPRGPAPPPGLTVATPNEAELERLEPSSSELGLAVQLDRARALRSHWAVDAVCVTRGAAGAVLVRDGGPPLAVPAPLVEGGDSCGAGDRFASRLACRLAAGARLEEAVADAVDCASGFVAAGGAAAMGADRPAVRPDPHSEDAAALSRRVRQSGGTLIATGGCFDLLHAGHVRMLDAARRLGDALIVCLNSDSSVRRLKGADRPLVPQEDRASVLAALACVDAVLVFDEDTPERALEELRPDVWAKGGDYEGAALPEERVLRRWGGRSVLLPYIEGHSTTRLIEEAACRV